MLGVRDKTLPLPCAKRAAAFYRAIFHTADQSVGLPSRLQQKERHSLAHSGSRLGTGLKEVREGEFVRMRQAE